jgi:hypothetical protein
LPAKARVEGAAAMMGGLDGQAWASGWGGAFRLVMGRGWLGPVLGVGGYWPTDTTMGDVRLRQWRIPVDIGVRATVTGRRMAWYGEMGVAAAVLRERALDLFVNKSGTAIELGARLSLGTRLATSGAVAPFLALSLDLVPDPPSTVALPMGTVGRSPHLWLGACLGVSWGMR